MQRERTISDARRARTLWVVTHPEYPTRMEVPARTPEEPRRVGWEHWYRRPVQGGLDELMRDPLQARDTGKPAEERRRRSEKLNASTP